MSRTVCNVHMYAHEDLIFKSKPANSSGLSYAFNTCSHLCLGYYLDRRIYQNVIIIDESPLSFQTPVKVEIREQFPENPGRR